MAARKTSTKKTTTPSSLPVPNTWYFLGEAGCPPPIPGMLCLVHTIDIDNEPTLYIAQWHKDLRVWLDTTNSALEASEKAVAYSPIFDSKGGVWMVS